MEKKIKIIIALVAAIAVLGLAFCFSQYWLQKQKENLGYVQFESFIKQETGGEVYFENKESGLKFKVPTGWNYSPSQMASMAMSSPDFKAFNDRPSSASVPAIGCWIGVSVKNSLSDDFDYMEIKKYFDNPELLTQISRDGDNYSIITVGGKNMLQKKLVIDNENGNGGNIVNVEFLKNNKIYLLETDIFGKDQDKCSQIFNDFLNSILIN